MCLSLCLCVCDIRNVLLPDNVSLAGKHAYCDDDSTVCFWCRIHCVFSAPTAALVSLTAENVCHARALSRFECACHVFHVHADVCICAGGRASERAIECVWVLCLCVWDAIIAHFIEHNLCKCITRPKWMERATSRLLAFTAKMFWSVYAYVCVCIGLSNFV